MTANRNDQHVEMAQIVWYPMYRYKFFHPYQQSTIHTTYIKSSLAKSFDNVYFFSTINNKTYLYQLCKIDNS